MTEERNSQALKILTAVLTLGIIILGVYTVNFYLESQNTIVRLKDEKSNLEEDLNELIAKYNEVIGENDIMSQELSEARSRIELLLESLKEMENANLPMIKRYQNEIRNLERERRQLFSTIDSLSKQNERLATAVDSTQNILRQRNVYADSLAQQNEILALKVEAGAQVKIINLKSEAVIVDRKNSVSSTQKSRRAEKIKTCFSIGTNSLANEGEKRLYIQVINPKNNLLGDAQQRKFGEKVLNYSALATINYQNEAFEECLLIDVEETDFIRGNYVVNVFENSTLLATSTFELK